MEKYRKGPDLHREFPGDLQAVSLPWRRDPAGTEVPVVAQSQTVWSIQTRDNKQALKEEGSLINEVHRCLTHTHTHTYLYTKYDSTFMRKKKLVSEYVCLVEGCSPVQKVKHTMLQEPSCSVGGNVHWYNHNEEQHGGL